MKSKSQSPKRRVRICKTKKTKLDCFYLRAGDHIYRPIRYAQGATHHGIYIGNGRVIHFTGVSNAGGWFSSGSFPSEEEIVAEVQETSIEEFMTDYSMDDLTVVEYKGPTLHHSTAVNRALKLLGSKEYHLIYNNCEHFAAHCKADQKVSQQAIKAFNRLVPHAWKSDIDLYDI